jgi:hypothetical protein
MSAVKHRNRKITRPLLVGAAVAAICGIGGAAIIAAPAAEPRPALQNSTYAVDVEKGNITVLSTRTHEPVFSVAAFAHAEYQILRAQSGLSAADDKTPFQVSQSFTIVSLYGTYLALRDQTVIEQESGALPGGGVRYWTIDLRHPHNLNLDPTRPLAAIPQPNGAIMSLATIYSPTQIAAALIRDPFVRKVVTPRAGESSHSILAALAHATLTNLNICLDAPRDVLSSFAIVSATGSTLGIRLGLPGRASCRGNLTNLGLTLPLLDSIKTEAEPDAHVVSPPQNARAVTIIEGHAPPETRPSGGQFSPTAQ